MFTCKLENSGQVLMIVSKAFPPTASQEAEESACILKIIMREKLILFGQFLASGFYGQNPK